MSILDDLKIKRVKDCKNSKEKASCIVSWVLAVILVLGLISVLFVGVVEHWCKGDKACVYADVNFANKYSTRFTNIYVSNGNNQSSISNLLDFTFDTSIDSFDYDLSLGLDIPFELNSFYSGDFTFSTYTNYYNDIIYTYNYTIPSSSDIISISDTSGNGTPDYLTRVWGSSSTFNTPSTSVTYFLPVRSSASFNGSFTGDPTMQRYFFTFTIRNLGVKHSPISLIEEKI